MDIDIESISLYCDEHTDDNVEYYKSFHDEVVKIVKQEREFNDALKIKKSIDFDRINQFAKEIIHVYGNSLEVDEIKRAVKDLQIDWSNHGSIDLTQGEIQCIISRYKQLDGV